MHRLINPNPENPVFVGESRVVDSLTPNLTPPGTTRSPNGSAIPDAADASVKARAEALGWRFDPAGPDGAYQASGPNGVVVVGYGGFADCVRLSEVRQADFDHKKSIGWPGF